DYDVIALQEPYLDRLSLTRSTPHWRVVYPTVHRADPTRRSRAVLLVSKKLSTNIWNPVAVPHPDICAITIRAEDAAPLHLFNLY
ncbi:hypothetical protein FKP32DRAFT_1532383, partial [Trametes sanguinea]